MKTIHYADLDAINSQYEDEPFNIVSKCGMLIREFPDYFVQNNIEVEELFTKNHELVKCSACKRAISGIDTPKKENDTAKDVMAKEIASHVNKFLAENKYFTIAKLRSELKKNKCPFYPSVVASLRVNLMIVISDSAEHTGGTYSKVNAKAISHTFFLDIINRYGKRSKLFYPAYETELNEQFYNFKDEDLVLELRNRGYIVSAKKIIEINL